MTARAGLKTKASRCASTMSKRGLGGSYFAVVDPKRGEVSYRQWAELTEIDGDNITLAFYHDEDWDAINDARGWKGGPSNQVVSTTKVVPYKTERHDLKEVLKNRVIYNQPNNPDISHAPTSSFVRQPAPETDRSKPRAKPEKTKCASLFSPLPICIVLSASRYFQQQPNPKNCKPQNEKYRASQDGPSAFETS